MMTHLFAAGGFVLGAIIGSFLNVCIHRLPRSESIVSPGSMCPSCGSTIAFYDNIPIVSYLLLRGRCRNCKTHIPFRYPLVEGLTGLLALAVLARFGPSLESLIYFVFCTALLVVTFIDLDRRIIPDVITLPGIGIGLGASFLSPAVSFWNALAGCLFGGGSLLAVAWIYTLVTGKQGMGGGDVKLLAMIGAFTGWKGVLFTIFAGSLLGTVTGIAVMTVKRKNLKMAIPFGPFLSIAAMVYLFGGTELIAWYWTLPG